MQFIKELFLNGLVSYILTGGAKSGVTVSGGTLIAVYAAGFIFVLAAAYLLGSLNFGIIISGKLYGDDVRKHGSGGSGSTNMMRTYGTKAAVATLALDALKGVVAVLIGWLVLGEMPFAGGYIAAFMCVVGHAFPVFFKFKGGKGVAVLTGAVLTLRPVVFLILLGVFVLVVATTRFVSLGSVMAMFIWPLVLTGYNTVYGLTGLSIAPVFTVLTALLVVYLHRENLKRIWNGTESKFTFKKSYNPADYEKPGEDDATGKGGATGKDGATGKGGKK